MEELEQTAAQAVDEIGKAVDQTTLDAVRVKYLGKKGFFTEQMKSLGKLPPEEKREAGAKINGAKQKVLEALNARRQALQDEELNRKLISVRLSHISEVDLVSLRPAQIKSMPSNTMHIRYISA